MRARELLSRFDLTEGAQLSATALATRVAELIRDGRLPAGVELPSERDLAGALGRSRGTIARAYEQLRHEGLAYTRHGAGTTVGCCPGPWASSRAADLVPILTSPGTPLPQMDDAIDLRQVRWEPLPDEAPSMAGDGGQLASGAASARSELLARLARHLHGQGIPAGPDQLLLTGGGTRALDVVLTTMVRPGERVLVPALTDPGVLALLRVRGLHPVALPVDREGRADVPGWLQRIRTRSARIAVVTATHATPAGTVLETHERRLLAEAAAAADVTLIDDASHTDLWIEEAPPPSLASFDLDGGDRTITVASTAAMTPAGASVGWIHTTSDAILERLRAVSATLDGAPSDPTVAVARGAFDDHDRMVRHRRQHLIEQTVAAIRQITPAAPHLAISPARGGPTRWIHVGARPGSAVADAARARRVLVQPGSACAVGRADPAAVMVALTGPIEDLLTGLRLLIAAVHDLG